MKCTRQKYKTLLNQGKQEAPDAQQAQVIVLWREINNIKSKVKDDQNSTNKHHTGKSKANRQLTSTNQGKQHTK